VRDIARAIRGWLVEDLGDLARAIGAWLRSAWLPIGVLTVALLGLSFFAEQGHTEVVLVLLVSADRELVLVAALTQPHLGQARAAAGEHERRAARDSHVGRHRGDQTRDQREMNRRSDRPSHRWHEGSVRTPWRKLGKYACLRCPSWGVRVCRSRARVRLRRLSQPTKVHWSQASFALSSISVTVAGTDSAICRMRRFVGTDESDSLGTPLERSNASATRRNAVSDMQ